MTYKETIADCMTKLGQDDRRVFLGYGLTLGLAMGTLAGVDYRKLREMPVAEGLMVSTAIGLALVGFKPVVYFERADFLMNAADAIVNHLNAMQGLSRGEFNPGVILRVTVGNRRKPLYTGPVHTANPADAFRYLVKFPVVELLAVEQVAPAYMDAAKRQDEGQSTMLFEFKDTM